MTTYRYLFADLLTSRVLAELPITNVSFTHQLNSIGAFQGELQITDVDETFMNISNATVPGRTAIFVDRNGQLQWGGVLWGRMYDSEAQKITLNGREFMSYFERRKILKDVSYKGTDQLTIASALMNAAQGATNGNIGIQVPTNTSGVKVDKKYYKYEMKSVASAVMDLSQALNGFDWMIDVNYNGDGSFNKTLRFGYPRIGDVYTASNVNAPVFEFPAGNIVKYSYEEDGSSAANTVYVTGKGSNEGKHIKSATASAQLAAGWPALEDNANYGDISDDTLLTNLAGGRLAAVSYPPTMLKLEANAFTDPVVGSYDVGDDVRVRIQDSRFPNGLDAVYRLVGITVTPGEAAGERATLTLSLPTG